MSDTFSTPREVEMDIELPAPPDVVWKALTDAAELMRWFPPQARVQPGVGGAIYMSWGPPWEGDSKITIWEPGKRLQYEWAFTHTPKSPVPVSVDFHLEGRGGSTMLRVVHAGFGTGKAWDQEYDGVSRGWNIELRGLRHYLLHHLGMDRRPIWLRKAVKFSPEEVAARLIAPGAAMWDGDITSVKEGDVYRLGTPWDDGRDWHGVAAYCKTPGVFSGSVVNLNQAYLRVESERVGDELQAWVWLSTYGMSESSFHTLYELMAAAFEKALS